MGDVAPPSHRHEPQAREHRSGRWQRERESPSFSAPAAVVITLTAAFTHRGGSDVVGLINERFNGTEVEGVVFSRVKVLLLFTYHYR